MVHHEPFIVMAFEYVRGKHPKLHILPFNDILDIFKTDNYRNIADDPYLCIGDHELY